MLHALVPRLTRSARLLALCALAAAPLAAQERVDVAHSLEELEASSPFRTQ